MYLSFIFVHMKITANANNLDILNLVNNSFQILYLSIISFYKVLRGV